MFELYVCDVSSYEWTDQGAGDELTGYGGGFVAHEAETIEEIKQHLKEYYQIDNISDHVINECGLYMNFNYVEDDVMNNYTMKIMQKTIVNLLEQL